MGAVSNFCRDCGRPISKHAQRCKSCATSGSRNGRFGTTASDETRRKISERLSKPNGRNGELHPMWKGDSASKGQGRIRAERMYPSRPCQVCGKTKSERHHVDGDTLNNAPENILHLCRPHHRRIHPGNGKRPLRPPEYADMGTSQITGDSPMFSEVVA